MKKTGKKLSLNKETISALSGEEMSSVKGGFTYSLSLGNRCQNSKELGQSSQFDCGVEIEKLRQAKFSN